MGLKLKSQIAGILFLLFTLTVLILGYFNMSILFEAMKSLAQEQSSALASNVVSSVEKSMPREGYTEEYLKLRMAQRGDLPEYLQGIQGLRSFHIVDSNGQVVFSYGPMTDRSQVSRPAIRQVFRSGNPTYHLWEYDSDQDAEGHPVGATGVMLPRRLSFEFYRPVMSDDHQPVGAYHLSLMVEEMPRRLHIMFLGNLLLSVVFLVTAFIAINIWTAHAINRPLGFILQAQDRIGKGDFSAHVHLDLPSTNEIVSISTSFNRMAADLRRFRKELEVKTRRLEELNSEYRRLNEHLESEVEEKTRELKEFFSVITHDLKVPLAAIQGYVDLLLRAPSLSEKQVRHVQAIGTACSHLLGLTRNMLDSIKYDADKIAWYMEDFDLAELTAEVRTQLDQALDDKRIDLTVEIPPLCRAVHGDRTKIAQVITNLLNNAVKFTPEGGHIELRARDRGAQVEVTLRDNGPGIVADQVPRLFEKFTQFHTVEGASSSIGLGLYIVGKILQGHQQTIRVVSQPGEGSSFAFTLAKSKAAPTLDVLSGEQDAEAAALAGEGKPS